VALAVPLPAGYTDLLVRSPRIASYEFFGQSVASLGSRLVVGAPGSNVFGDLPGRVYVMPVDGSAPLVIENPAPAPRDLFGASVAVGGGEIIVGAPWDDMVAQNAGTAYVFDGTTGALLRTLFVPGSSSNSQCARQVAALGGDALVVCDGVYRFDA